MSLVSNKFSILDITQDTGKEIKSRTDQHDDAFQSNGLVDTLLKSLNQPRMQKSIPSFILYDALGLQLFDELSQSAEYYLTNAERSILQKRADELANRVRNDSIVFELGSGSLSKTKLILDALEKQQKRATYYALDLNRQELEKSLSSLGTEYQYIQLIGLLGTYEQGMHWLKQHSSKMDTQKLVLWLGSSIGNETPPESIDFLRRLKQTCLQPGDLCVIGFDRQKDESIISNAYNDCRGNNRKFVLNGLNNVNRLLGQTLLNPNDFDYDSAYQSRYGRQAAHYRALKSVNLIYNRGQSLMGDEKLVIPIDKDELIQVIYSHKFSNAQIMETLNGAGLNLVSSWSDDNDLYRLVLSEYLKEKETIAPTLELRCSLPCFRV